MKKTHVFYLCAIILISRAVASNNQAIQPLQQTSPIQIFTYFQKTSQSEESLEKTTKLTSKNLFNALQQELSDLESTYITNKNVFEALQKEVSTIEKTYLQAIEQAKKIKENKKTQAQKIYDTNYKIYQKLLPTLSIDAQESALNAMKETISAHAQTLQDFEDEYTKNIQTLTTKFNHNKTLLDTKKAETQQELVQTQDRYYKLQITLNAEEEDALIQAQREHITYLEERSMDEIYTSAIQPSVWPIWQIYPQNYSYQANENIIICNGGLQADGYSINSNLQKNILDQQNHRTLNALTMIAWAMKKSQAEDGYEHVIGLQSCKKDGNNITCKTIPDLYKKSVTEYTAQQKKKLTDTH